MGEVGMLERLRSVPGVGAIGRGTAVPGVIHAQGGRTDQLTTPRSPGRLPSAFEYFADWHGCGVGEAE
jgi:hypothetical protein